MGAESAGRETAPWAVKAFSPPSDVLAKLWAARNELCQSLEKTRALGNQLNEANKRLQMFQDRLSPVRRSLLPLQEKSKITESLTQRINKTLEPAMQVLKMFDVVSKIRVRLVKEPRDDFDGYLAALIQLEEAVDYLKHNSIVAINWLQEAVAYLNYTGSTDTVRLRRLNESLATLQSQQAGGAHELDGGLLVTALGKLEKEFKRLISEHSQPIELPEQMAPRESNSPPSSELDYLVSYPPQVLQKLQTIIEKLAGNVHYQRCVDAYQDTRLVLCEESLKALDVRYMNNVTPKTVNSIPWDDLQNMVEKWAQQLEVIVKMLYTGERRLARQVFKNVGQAVWVEILYDLAEPEMDTFLRFGESVAASERSPEKLCKLLEMYESMEKCEHSVIQVFDGQACGEIRSRYRELLKQIVYAAGKTFWDIDDWIKEQKEGVSLDGRVMQLCSWVVNYLGYVIALFPITLSKVLRIAQSWEGEGAEDKGLPEGLALILNTLEGLVETRAKEFHDPALRHIFLMNNMYYIRNRVKNNALGPLLGEDWISEVGRKVSTNALKYQREAWQQVLQHLNSDGLKGSSSSKSGSRDLVRQKLRAFNAAFDETVQIQSKWLIAEKDLRDGTLAAVTQMVVPAYRSFLGHFGSLLEGRGRDSDKYIKYTPEILDRKSVV